MAGERGENQQWGNVCPDFSLLGSPLFTERKLERKLCRLLCWANKKVLKNQEQCENLYVNSFVTKFPRLQTNREIKKQLHFVYFRYIMSNILDTHDTKSKIGMFHSAPRLEMESVKPKWKEALYCQWVQLSFTKSQCPCIAMPKAMCPCGKEC